MVSFEQMKSLIVSKPEWCERAILAIYKKQTEDEQRLQETNRNNGVGFTGADARILSDLAQQILRGHHLSEKQLTKIAYRKIAKYAVQLAKIAGIKVEHKKAIA